MKRILCGIAAAGSLVMVASAANGSIVYQYATDSQSYSGPLGGTVSVQLYAVETSSTTGPGSSLIVGDNGLNGAGGAINQVGTGGATLSALNLNATAFDGGTALTTKHVNPAEADFTENVGLADSQGVFGSTAGLPPGVTQVFLGTLVVKLPSTPGTTSYAFGKNPAGAGSTVTFTNTYNLDANGSTQDPQYGGPGSTAADGNIYSWTGANNTVGRFSVTATPEPSALALVGCGGILALRRRRKA